MSPRCPSGALRPGKRNASPAQSIALFLFQVVILVLLPSGTLGHSMGEAIPIAYVKGPDTAFAANVIAEYFGQQMGREISLLPVGSSRECLNMLRSGRVPLAVLDRITDETGSPEAVVVDSFLTAGAKTAVLVMGKQAASQLQFSLVTRYMEKLKRTLTDGDWERGQARVMAGEGVRKAAIDMLRERDLI